ncbi:MAG: hypothetical protein ABJC10_03015 [Acidobacteriota bacterium]
MENYILYSNTNKATHNAYTRCGRHETSPFNSLRRAEAATRTSKRQPPVYYLAIGLQASLVGYRVVSFFASVAYQWSAYYLVLIA